MKTFLSLVFATVALGAQAFDITLTWDPPNDMEGVSGYRLQDVSNGRTNSSAISTNAFNWPLAGLAGSHTFTLFSTNQVGDEASSPSSTLTIGQSTSQVANLRFLTFKNNPTTVDVTLAWDPPTDWKNATGLRLEQILKAWPSGLLTTNSYAVGITQTWGTLNGLSKGVHDFRMFTTNAFGDGLPSNTARLWSSPPSASTNLRTLNLSNP